ncbi:hypothetical protein Fmac_032890 [Flemingia macrophylla]|uniref:Uncharacterized protein n=1 Tax=Flemingia macrophylla TaxID=520843 RepID=A0ABD1L676_9FABA
MTTILVSVLLRSNLEWMSILRLMLQTPVVDHHNSRDKALHIEDGSYLIAVQRVHDVATDTSVETRKLKGKLDALVNLVTQLVANQKPALLQEYVASLLPMTAILVSVLLRSNLEWMSILRLMLQTPIADHHISKDKALDREDGSQLLAVQGVHDVATDTSAETRKLEGKLDALVNLVTQLAANPKPASVARVYVIRSSNDHHTSVCHSSQQSGVDENPEAYAANTYSADHHKERDK